MKRLLILILTIGMVIGVASSSWAVPMYINIQGRLTPAPETIPDELEFHIYDSESGGTRLGGYNDMLPGPDIMNAEGVFNANIELTTLEFVDDHEYWLEIRVDGIGTFSPRQRIVSVPFAITARNAIGGVVSADADAATRPAVYGHNASSGSGVRGDSDSGYGVAGYASGSSVAGVVGINANNWGVAGIGRIGVAGAGVTAGGSFESNRGHGVYGRSTLTGWGALRVAGVRGEGVAFGVWGRGAYGVRGDATGSTGSGVYGYSTSSGDPAVYGYNRHALTGIGVKGVSFGDYGVYGIGAKSKAGVIGLAGLAVPNSFPSGGRVGIYGESDYQDGVASYGVYGYARSEYSRGVYGKVTGSGDNQIGVYGDNQATGGAGLNRGVFGKSRKGYGVDGQGEIAGVRGVGLGSGGHGVVGSSLNPAYSAVMGTTLVGHGVYGSTGALNKAGVYANNSSGGIALQVGKGKIKVARTSGTTYRASGTVDFGVGIAAIDVPNTLVTADSIIILTKQESSSRADDDLFWVHFRTAGASFRIARRGALGSTKVGYLIIN